MTWWLWLTIGVLVGAAIGLFVAALVALADESYEGRGTLEFDTPEARDAMKRLEAEPYVTGAGQRFIERDMGKGDAFERIFRRDEP